MSTRNRIPEDGIVASSRPKGWAATRWMETFDELAKSHHAQLARGRTLARGGRVRDLWFSPGLASAEVVTNRDAYRVTIRTRVFEEDEWDRVVQRLLRKLVDIAAMLEGELPSTLVDDLEGLGLRVLPTLKELDGVCECADFHMPCEHMAAVHNVIAEALDGDPFLLLTLRGLNRDQLLARLRRTWGDDRPLTSDSTDTSGPPPESDPDWSASPTPLAPLHLRIEAPDDARPGVYALGPPPGRADLGSTLRPLYEAGSKAAMELAYGDADASQERGRPGSRWEGFERGVRGKDRPPAATSEARPSVDISAPITERLVDLLAELESAKSKTLAERLGVSVLTIRGELVELEKLGIVYRTGQTRGTRWWLG